MPSACGKPYQGAAIASREHAFVGTKRGICHMPRLHLILFRAETQPYAYANISDREEPTRRGLRVFQRSHQVSILPSICGQEGGIELFARAYETLG